MTGGQPIFFIVTIRTIYRTVCVITHITHLVFGASLGGEHGIMLLFSGTFKKAEIDQEKAFIQSLGAILCARRVLGQLAIEGP
ncbi:hypothetical protein [Salinivibrio costicola]|uniref:hypothetical protein n=1 Tax=Salinivibrio costicola TaxID=51367 RepID=UPI00039A008D|nr:hypothetical protein [Salinivibrio costicola]